MLNLATELGRDIRVGLEDLLTLPGGESAPGNAELVGWGMRLAHARKLA